MCSSYEDYHGPFATHVIGTPRFSLSRSGARPKERGYVNWCIASPLPSLTALHTRYTACYPTNLYGSPPIAERQARSSHSGHGWGVTQTAWRGEYSAQVQFGPPLSVSVVCSLHFSWLCVPCCFHEEAMAEGCGNIQRPQDLPISLHLSRTHCCPIDRPTILPSTSPITVLR